LHSGFFAEEDRGGEAVLSDPIWRRLYLARAVARLMQAFQWDWETVVCRTPYKALTLFLEMLRLEEQDTHYIPPESRQEILIGAGLSGDVTDEILGENMESKYDVGIEITSWRDRK